jgi:hypothetical protein
MEIGRSETRFKTPKSPWSGIGTEGRHDKLLPLYFDCHRPPLNSYTSYHQNTDDDHDPWGYPSLSVKLVMCAISYCDIVRIDVIVITYVM